MGLFRSFPLNTDNYTNATLCMFNSCLSDGSSRILDVTFGVIMLLIFLVSSVANPLVVYLKIWEKSVAGNLFAILASIDFLMNVVRAPHTAYKLLNNAYEEYFISTASTFQIAMAIFHSALLTSEFGVVFVLSSTRFLKIKQPFMDMNPKVVILSCFILNLFLYPSLIYSFAFASDKIMFLSFVQSVNSGTAIEFTTSRYINLILAIVIQLGSLVFSIGAVIVLARNPNITEQNRKNKRKACKTLVLMSIVLLMSTIAFLLVRLLKNQISAFSYFIFLFISFTFLPHLIAVINPLMVLYFGYSRAQIQEQLNIVKHD